MKKLNFPGSPFLVIIFLQLLYSCLPEGDYKTAVNSEPRKINGDWEISDPASEGFNNLDLQDVYEIMFAEDKFITSRSLLIVKNGKLVSESYFRDMNDIHLKNNIQGITKGVTSLLTGFAYDKGLIEPSSKLYEYIPGYFDGNRDKREITISHVLTMLTGLEWENDVHTVDLTNIYRFPSSLRVVLTKPFKTASGTEFHYNHGAPQLAMGVIREVFNVEETDTLVKSLFDPLGIKDYVWEKHTDGLHYGGFGLHLTPRDLARIGQFCLQKGSWNGRQILSEEWIDVSTHPVLDENMTGSSLNYGYYWWIHPENNACFGMGDGGQYLYLVPEEELVIVHTANPSTGSGYEGITLGDFLQVVDGILAALE